MGGGDPWCLKWSLIDSLVNSGCAIVLMIAKRVLTFNFRFKFFPKLYQPLTINVKCI